jgi:histidine triad (HIT) family protein
MIGRGDLDARIVYSDELVVAFDDITPQAPVHTLVIPRAHYSDMGDDVPAEVAAALFSAIAKVAAIKGVDTTGYRVIINNGRDASQTVQHLHVHVMGGARFSHGMVRFDS